MEIPLRSKDKSKTIMPFKLFSHEKLESWTKQQNFGNLPKFDEERSPTNSIVKESCELHDIQNLLDTGLSGPNIYHILTTVEKPQLINLQIPNTLIKVPHQNAIYVKTNAKGSISIRRDENSISSFFKNSTSLPTLDGSLPKFVHIDDENHIHVCKDNKESLHWWAVCTSKQHMLQQFIPPQKRTLSKIRVHWKTKEGSKYLLVTNLSSIPRNQRASTSTTASSKKPEKKIGLYQHSLSDFKFAGKLLKTSFSPSMPFRSMLKRARNNSVNSKGERPSFSLYSTLKVFSSKEDLNDDQAAFLVRSSNLFQATICEADSIAEIDNMLNSIIELINKKVEKSDKRVLTELLADFMCDDCGKWYFLKCKAHKLDYIPIKLESASYLTPDFNPNLDHSKKPSYSSNHSFDDSNLNIKRNVAEPYISVQSLNRRLMQLEQKHIKHKSEASLFIDLNDVVDKSKKSYLSTTIPKICIKSELPSIKGSLTSKEHLKTKDIYGEYLDRIAKHYDNVRGLAAVGRRVKEKEVCVLEKYRHSKSFEAIIESIKTKLYTDQDVGHIFLNARSDFINIAMDYICKGSRNKYLCQQMKKSNLCIGMKQYEFARTMSIIKDELKFHHIIADDIEAIIKNIEQFQDDVII
ncbi:unnamed protein product [Blepharisma stoltei]|uniref:Uncharacterized protein n=1 Tax=Blepharisma stoltei TaxID=1481888 RepID=A0AAU9J1R7_9CILI|nr:unnamed protein product [Blepharisma stoltei]